MTKADLTVDMPMIISVAVTGQKPQEFKTKVEEIRTDYVLLAPVLMDDKTVGFGVSCNTSLLITTDGNAYIWENVLLPLVKLKDNVYYKAVLPGDAKPYNRRGAYRVYIGESMLVNIFKDGKPHSETVLVRDISETGFGFVSREEYALNRVLKLTIALNDKRKLQLGAHVVRREFSDERNSYQYGCKFIEANSILSTYLAARQRQRQAQKNK